ncbi:MAG: class I SAM-dependent methyltransferase [Clostridia bacterium]|nr:class I SAM-dependent methyltransferase [Clostridia bacterium]
MYDDFANIYDLVMRDTPYADWISYYKAIFARFHRTPELVLELGCGTGNITTRMAAEGYDMIGLDNSLAMLSHAKEKNQDILYLLMDMTDFELYGTVDAIISGLDCMNYVTEDIDKVFSLVKNYLNPGGLFIFDIQSPYKLKELLPGEPIICDEDDIVYIWESEVEQSLCHFYITFFTKNENGTYSRCDEEQTQRIYEIDELSAAAEAAGLTVRGVFDAFSFTKPKAESERIFFVVSKE